MPLLAAAAPAEPPPDSCPGVEACLDRMIAIGTHQEVDPVVRKLKSYGPAAADALVALLNHAESRTREVAGMALADFERIDPRHLPALIAAYEGRGALPANGWLPRAIAATGSGDALAYLQARFLEKPDFSSNAQIHFALARFGDRARPFLLAQIEACRAGAPEERCSGVLSALRPFDGEMPAWAVEPILALAGAPAARPGVRRMGEDFAIGRRHPSGLVYLGARLETELARREARWELEQILKRLGDYGDAAASFGPRIVPLLASDHPDVRAEAALTLGRIGARTGGAELLALAPRFDDDWLLAYNGVEGLGRMRVERSRDLLKRIASSHWHRGVRRNAERALSRLDGGAFARPGVDNDPQPYRLLDETGEEFLYFGGLRYAGDAPPRCDPAFAATAWAFRQDPPARMSWPASGARRLAFQGLPEPETRELLAAMAPIGSRARVPFRVKLRSGGLVTGYDQGEWGGAIIHLRPDGSVERLAGGNPEGAFRMGNRLYIVEGLSHGVSSNGWIMTVAGDPPRLDRAIRLPAEAAQILATARRLILVRTNAGDLALREDGRLADPESLGLCTKGPS